MHDSVTDKLKRSLPSLFQNISHFRFFFILYTLPVLIHQSPNKVNITGELRRPGIHRHPRFLLLDEPAGEAAVVKSGS